MTEWEIPQFIPRVIFRVLGRPQIDLFASAQRGHSALFSISKGDHQVSGHDALHQAWHYDLMYAFPPPHLIL